MACLHTKESVQVKLICQNTQCNKEFSLYQYDNIPERHYCSSACYVFTKTVPLAERLWSKILRCEHTPYCLYCCWAWKAASNKLGYGYLSSPGKKRNRSMLAHRLAWEEWHNKRMPSHLFACHYCHVPSCCNPLHVYAGTPLQNVQDTIMAQRHSFGERNGHAKMTAKDISLVFSLYENGDSQHKIAQHFSVSRKTIGRILQQQQWKEVTSILQIDQEDINSIAKSNLSRAGSVNPSSKLTEENISLIFSLAHSGHSQQSIGQRFNVSQSTISKVLRGGNWLHVSISPMLEKFDISPIDIAALPYMRYEHSHDLPRFSALYFLFQQANNVLYVGRSIDICERFRVHHAFRHFADIRSALVGYYTLEPSMLASAEIAAIQYFKPSLNHTLKYRDA